MTEEKIIITKTKMYLMIKIMKEIRKMINEDRNPNAALKKHDMKVEIKFAQKLFSSDIDTLINRLQQIKNELELKHNLSVASETQGFFDDEAETEQKDI
jgi:hypothetical protein